MILKAFHVIETLAFGALDAVYHMSSNSLLKAVGWVTFDVLSEIFVYVVLGLCCVLIAIIIQADNKGKLEEADTNNYQESGDKIPN